MAESANQIAPLREEKRDVDEQVEKTSSTEQKRDLVRSASSDHSEQRDLCVENGLRHAAHLQGSDDAEPARVAQSAKRASTTQKIATTQAAIVLCAQPNDEREAHQHEGKQGDDHLKAREREAYQHEVKSREHQLKERNTEAFQPEVKSGDDRLEEGQREAHQHKVMRDDDRLQERKREAHQHQVKRGDNELQEGEREAHQNKLKSGDDLLEETEREAHQYDQLQRRERKVHQHKAKLSGKQSEDRTAAVVDCAVPHRKTDIFQRTHWKPTWSGGETTGSRKESLQRLSMRPQSMVKKMQEEHSTDETHTHAVSSAKNRNAAASFWPEKKRNRPREAPGEDAGEEGVTRRHGETQTPVSKSDGKETSSFAERVERCETRKSAEKGLREILCDLDREALECMQGRMQRSVALLLETRTEKEAEQSALLRERRQLDALLADAQRKLNHYAALRCSRLREGAILPYSIVKCKEYAATDTTKFERVAVLNTSRAPRPAFPSVPGSGGKACGEDVADKVCAVAPLALPLPQRRRNSETPDTARYAELEEKVLSRKMLVKTEEEGDESILADLLDDLLHKYGPAAVKGVGVAASKVRQGIGVLRQELLALQQHQQAMEKQRAIEKHARLASRREAEVRRLHSQRSMRQCQHAAPLGSSERPQVCVYHGRPVADKASKPAQDGNAVITPVGLSAAVGSSSSNPSTQPYKETRATTLSAMSQTSTSNSSTTTSGLLDATGGQTDPLLFDEKLPQSVAIRSQTATLAPHSNAVACEPRELSEQVRNLSFPCSFRAAPNEQRMQGGKVAVAGGAPGGGGDASAAATVVSTTMQTRASFPNTEADPAELVRRETNVSSSRQYGLFSSGTVPAPSGWKGLFSVEGKSSPPPSPWLDNRILAVEKQEGKFFLNDSNTRSSAGAERFSECFVNVEHLHAKLPSTSSAYACAYAVPSTSAPQPSSYRKLGSRKARLEKTAASLDSLSRNVVEAVGSVKHTVARWLFTSADSSALNVQQRLSTLDTAGNDSGAARSPSSVDFGDSLRTVELGAQQAEGVSREGNDTVVCDSDTAATSTTAALRRQTSLQFDQANASTTSAKKCGETKGREKVTPDLSAKAALESEATTTKSSACSVTAQLAGEGITQNVSVLVQAVRGGRGDVPLTEAVAGRKIRSEKPPQRSKPAGHQVCSTEGRHTPPVKAQPGGKDAVCGRCATGKLATPRVSEVTKSTVPVIPSCTASLAVNCNSALPAAAADRCGLFYKVSDEGRDGSKLFSGSSGGVGGRTADKEVYPAEEDDPAVIEAVIRVDGRNGKVALPLVVRATEQCGDIAEEWVDRHWVQLQHTQFWLKRGKSGNGEAMGQTEAAGISAKENGVTGALSATEVRDDDAQPGKVVGGQKGLTARCVGGNSPGKTTFLTRSRAIRSLDAFLKYAEASSENLPVRITEDWDTIIRSPSAETTSQQKQWTWQKPSAGKETSAK